MLARIITVLFVFLFLQIPFFMTQYQQRLEGHLAELQHWQAAQAKENLPEVAARMKASPDFRAQGLIMEEMLDRLASFTQASAALSNALPWTKPFTFVRHLNLSLAWETLQGFRFGFALTLETIVYMIVGFLCSLFFQPRKPHAAS